MSIDTDIIHKQYYDGVRADHPEIPAWEDLSEEQKARMRAINDEYVRGMNELGDKISRGEI